MPADATTLVVQQGFSLLSYAETSIWMMLRVGAALMAAPMIGTRALPARVRLVLTAVLALTLAPMVPEGPGFVAIDAPLVLSIGRELLIGIALGMVLRMAFEAGAFAGELVSMSMGLSFAQMADPLRGTQSVVVGQIFYLAFGLLFFALNGHLALVELIFRSYQSVPIGAAIPHPQAFLSGLPGFMPVVLRTGVQIALPITMSMLIANLAFGLLGRAAPALNPIAVGLPATLLLGMVLLAALIGELQAPIEQMLDTAFLHAAALLD